VAAVGIVYPDGTVHEDTKYDRVGAEADRTEDQDTKYTMMSNKEETRKGHRPAPVPGPEPLPPLSRLLDTGIPVTIVNVA